MQQVLDYPDTLAYNRDALRAGFVAPLPYLGLLNFSGADAVSFLHRQLTNDVEHLRPGDARLAGYCSPQGRLLASFLLWKNNDGLQLQLPRELLPALQKRLKMFVLRDKVAIADASDSITQLGLGGSGAAAALATWFSPLPEQPYTKIENAHGVLVRVADAFGAPRYLWTIPTADLAQIWPALTTSLTPCADNAWRLADIDAGVAQISLATQEKFVPQMVNFDVVGGVNFKKGCYPGQEIVARTQYLGKSKRHMLAASVATATTTIAAGTDVYASDDPSQPCGSIVNAERCGTEQLECLVSLRLPLADGISVHAGASDGPVLRFQPLPYPLPGENAPARN